MTKSCDNTSVGVLISDGAGSLLMFHRATRPVGVAAVAGHIDDHGSAEDAARAEVREEVGLRVDRLTLLTATWRNNACRRGDGPRGPGHAWSVYRADASGQISANEREALNARWYRPETLRQLADRTLRYASGLLADQDFVAAPGIEPVWLAFLVDAGFLALDDDQLRRVERLATRSP